MAEPRAGSAGGSLKSWLPVVLWAGVIFVFSTDWFSGAQTAGVVGPLMRFLFPGISPEDLALAHFLLRKLGHFTAYLLFTVLIMRALHRENHGRTERRRILISFVIATLYAISDEFHQSFVPSRGASVIDVVIDMCGGIAGIFCSHRRNRGKKPA